MSEKDREREIATKEAYAATAEHIYFALRPELDSKEARRIFDAAFGRGWITQIEVARMQFVGNTSEAKP